MNKHFVLLFILVLNASILVAVEPAYSVTKPSVPEFTVEIIGDRLVLSIKNPSYDPSGSEGFYYNVRVKAHNSTEWDEVYTAVRSEQFPTYSSSSEYTTTSYWLWRKVDKFEDSTVWRYYEQYADLDFQVEAMIGHFGRVVVGGWPGWGFYGEKSGWSETQTVINHNLNPDLVKISISSPTNYETYATDNVFLNLTITGETSWIGYSLDGQNNVTLTENTVKLSGLSNGRHNITVYATEIEGALTKSETKYFSITQTLDTDQIIDKEFPNAKTGLDQKPKTDPLEVIALVAVATIGIAFVIYFTKIKKHKRIIQTELPFFSG